MALPTLPFSFIPIKAPATHHSFFFPRTHHPSEHVPFSFSSSSSSKPPRLFRLLSPSPTKKFLFTCFSKAQRQSGQEIEFERLFSNLNQATLKREPGIFFLKLISSVANFFYYWGSDAVNADVFVYECYQEASVVPFFLLLAPRYVMSS